MSEVQNWLHELQEDVDEANNFNIFYLASISEYRTLDAEEAPQNELEKALENVERDKQALIKKLEEIQAMKNDISAEADGDVEILAKLEQIMSEVPQPPSANDMRAVSLDSLDDDVDVSSDDIFDDDESLNESKTQQISQFEEIVDLLKDLKEQEKQIKDLENEKSKARDDMFEARERGQSTKSSQDLQKFYFDTLKEFKDTYERQKKDIKRRIQNLLPKAGEYLKDNLLLTLDQLKSGEAQKSPEVVQERPKTPSPIKSPSPVKSPTPNPATQPPPSQTPPVIKSPSKFRSKLPQRGKNQIAITADPRVQQEIERHKSKLARATTIKQHGTLKNLQTAEQWSNMPRMIPPKVVQERKKQHSNVLKIAKSIGNVKRVGIKPSLGAPMVPSSSDVRASEVNQMRLKNASMAQRRLFQRPRGAAVRGIVDEVLGRDERTMKEMIRGMTMEQRQQAERKDVLKLINALISQGSFFDTVDEAQSFGVKINALRERLRRMFELIRTVMATYRGVTFLPDEPAQNRFIDYVIDYFKQTANFNNFRSTLARYFTNVPLPRFRVFQTPQMQNFVPTPTTPSSRIQRPSTTPGRTPTSSRLVPRTPQGVARRPIGRIHTKTPLARRPMTANIGAAAGRTLGLPKTPFQRRLDMDDLSMESRSAVKTKVQQQVRNLSQSNLKKSIKEPSTRHKLDAFTSGFCKIFIQNQQNRANSFEVWSKTFRNNLNPILNDLQSFYSSLPHAEFKKFNRSEVEKSLQHLLKYVYNETRNKNLNSLQCKNLIGSEMNKLIEGKHLKSLGTAMGVFVEGVKELMRPYIEEMERTSGRSGMRLDKDNAPRVSFPLEVLPSMTKQKHDESFLGRRGPVDGMLLYPLNNIIPSASVPIFKKIIGTPRELKNIEITQNIAEALRILLEHCEDIDMKIYQVLISEVSSFTKIFTLQSVLHDFVEQVIHMLFNNNNERFFREIQEVRDLYNELEIRQTITALGTTIFSKFAAHLMLLDPYNFDPPGNEPIVHEVLRFIKDVRYMEQKYIWRVLKGQIYGKIERYRTDAPFESDDLIQDDENDEIVAEILSRIRINQPIRAKPHQFTPPYLVERDILYVACQLTNRDEDLSEDKMQNFVISVARRYQAREISEHGALRAITQLLHLMPCIPVGFYQKFVYNKDNPYFEAIHFEEPLYNAAIRNTAMFEQKDKLPCMEDKLVGNRELRFISNQIEEFMRVHNNDINDLVAALERDENFDQMHAITLHGVEESNNGNGMLGIPASVVSGDLTQGAIENIHINAENAPQTNVANAEILRMLDEIEEKLDAQAAEIGHLENSRMAPNAIVHQLHPNALKRKNFWQSRGSEMPQWFPGIYTVFPDSLLSMPIKSNASAADLLLHAWRTMAPPINA